MATEGGLCMVCGKTAMQRCAQCLKVGHQDFWFCSREHQKLVWRTHKRFCGVPLKDFVWPPFTEEEASDFIELAQVPRENMKGDVVHRWADEVSNWEENKSIGRTFEDTVKEVTAAGLATTRKARKDWNEVCRSYHRLLFLFHVPQKDHFTMRTVKYCQYTAKDPLGALLDFGKTNWFRFDPRPFWFPLLQKLLTFFTILAQYYRDGGMVDVYKKELDWTKEEVKRWCREVVAKEEPDMAKGIIYGMDYQFGAPTYMPILMTNEPHNQCSIS